MNDQLIALLIEWLQDIRGFAAQELPELANELLRYHFYSDILIIVVCLLGIMAAKKINDIIIKNDNDYLGFNIIPLTLGLVALGALLISAAELIKITTAPKIYVVEWVLQKTKGR